MHRLYIEQQKKTLLRKYLPDHLIEYAYANYSQRLVKGLKNHFLLSKILKEKYFWTSKFKTTNKTLDPRPETELIIEECLKKYREDKRNLSILDLCAGTGCIGISLQKELPNSFITFTDISKDALKVCKYNVRYHKIFHKCKFIISNMFEGIPENKKYTILVTNPPYLTDEEIKKNDILQQDPYGALYGGEDGLLFYKNIAENLKRYITEYAFIEICAQKSQEIIDIFQKFFQDIYVVNDLSGLPRVLVIKI